MHLLQNDLICHFDSRPVEGTIQHKEFDVILWGTNLGILNFKGAAARVDVSSVERGFSSLRTLD